MGELDQLNFTCWRWREFWRKRWQRQRRWIFAVLFGPWQKSGVWVQPGKGKKGKGGKGKGKKKGKGRGKGAGEVAGWDGWNQVETDDKTSCMSLCLDSTRTIDSWYFDITGQPQSLFQCHPKRVVLVAHVFVRKKEEGGRGRWWRWGSVDKPWLSGETLNVCENRRESSCV